MCITVLVNQDMFKAVSMQTPKSILVYSGHDSGHENTEYVEKGLFVRLWGILSGTLLSHRCRVTTACNPVFRCHDANRPAPGIEDMT